MQAIRPPLEPWALDPEARRLCLFYDRSLRHKVQIQVGNATHLALKRDRSLAISDRHVANPANVEISRHASRRGFYKHRVLTNAGWKGVYENATTGEFTMGGRDRRAPWELTWNPPPPILSAMRAKIPPQAQLIEQPHVPGPRTARVRRPLMPTDVTASPNEPGRSADPRSRSERELHGSQLKFIRLVEG